MKNKLLAGIFAILLGSVGLQFFYLGNEATFCGRKGNGILYGVLCLLFWWTGVPAVIGLIMGILMLTMTDDEFAQKYDVATENTSNAFKGF